MHCLYSVLTLSAISTYVAPAVARAIVPSRESQLAPRTTAVEMKLQEQLRCHNSCPVSCTRDALGAQWICDVLDGPQPAGPPVYNSDDKGYQSSRFRRRIDANGMKFGTSHSCDISCRGSCEETSKGAEWTCHEIEGVDATTASSGSTTTGDTTSGNGTAGGSPTSVPVRNS